MRIRLTQFSVGLEYTEEALRRAVARKLGVAEAGLGPCTVVRRSIDARRRHGPVAHRVGFWLLRAYGPSHGRLPKSTLR